MIVTSIATVLLATSINLNGVVRENSVPLTTPWIVQVLVSCLKDGLFLSFAGVQDLLFCLFHSALLRRATNIMESIVCVIAVGEPRYQFRECFARQKSSPVHHHGLRYKVQILHRPKTTESKICRESESAFPFCVAKRWQTTMLKSLEFNLLFVHDHFSD